MSPRRWPCGPSTVPPPLRARSADRLAGVGALWAELYGTTHLGAIRSLVWALVVLTSAVAPVALGAPLDAGVSVHGTATGCAAFAVAASILAAWPQGRRGRVTGRTA